MRQGARAFKTKAGDRAAVQARQQAAAKAGQGRDPYGLFKEAIVSQPNAEATAAARMSHKSWREHRAAYSRAKIAEVRLHSPAPRPHGRCPTLVSARALSVVAAPSHPGPLHQNDPVARCGALRPAWSPRGHIPRRVADLSYRSTFCAGHRSAARRFAGRGKAARLFDCARHTSSLHRDCTHTRLPGQADSARRVRLTRCHAPHQQACRTLNYYGSL